MNPVPLPNMRPYPNTQKAIEETANTMKFLERMFVEFLTRQKPVSTHANPKFMKNTSIAVNNVHIVSATTLGSMPTLLGLSNLTHTTEPQNSTKTQNKTVALLSVLLCGFCDICGVLPFIRMAR